jgi:hypothetical protein
MKSVLQEHDDLLLHAFLRVFDKENGTPTQVSNICGVLRNIQT